jgi:hypothetical protein
MPPVEEIISNTTRPPVEELITNTTALPVEEFSSKLIKSSTGDTRRVTDKFIH